MRRNPTWTVAGLLLLLLLCAACGPPEPEPGEEGGGIRDRLPDEDVLDGADERPEVQPDIPLPPTDCDDDDDEDETTLAIRHECTAAWMPINNHITLESDAEGEGHDDWNGVLMQLGAYTNVAAAVQVIKVTTTDDNVTSINIPADGSGVWVNIVADREAQPIHEEDVGLLWPDPDRETPCNAVDHCDDSSFFGGCEADAIEEIPMACLRGRVLHRDFEVAGIITYWTGECGYEVEAELVGNHHVEFTFEFKNPVRIDVNGAPVYEFGTVKKIEVQEAPGTAHGVHEDPPWPGFGLP